MLVVASGNGAIGISAAVASLQGGGSVLDAVEAGIRVVEDNPLDNSVGLGGIPNVDGDVELDASIMEGATRRAGAVGALRGYRHAITVARGVLESSPHVLIVGEGARQVAAAMGMVGEDLLTTQSRELWTRGMVEGFSAGSPLAGDEPYVALPLPPGAPVLGTVNFIARDSSGHLAVGVSTSGLGWKHPGRLGDSPVIGAGNYCDDRYGAAACTGWGELALRAGTARSVVEALRSGLSVEAACVGALQDLAELGGVSRDSMFMDVIGVDPVGNHCAATTRVKSEYAYQGEGMLAARVEPRLIVDPYAA
jgi:beta-aspartyl-peptidase (threonine type)